MPLRLARLGCSQIFNKVLENENGCLGADGSRKLVLDVGANFGYFAVG